MVENCYENKMVKFYYSKEKLNKTNIDDYLSKVDKYLSNPDNFKSRPMAHQDILIIKKLYEEYI